MQSHAFKSFVYGCQVRLYRDDLFPNTHHSWHWALGEGKVKKAILSPKMGIPFSVWNHFRQFVLLYICFAVRSVPGSLHHALYKYTPARVELRGRSKCAVKCLFRRRRTTLRVIICVPNCVIFTEKSPKKLANKTEKWVQKMIARTRAAPFCWAQWLFISDNKWFYCSNPINLAF